MARGGFRSVELNTVGWTAALAPTGLVGACVGAIALGGGSGAAVGLVAGGATGFVIARLLDLRRDRRRWINLAVVDADEATQVLRRSGVAAAGGRVEVDGKPLHYVTVRARDQLVAQRLVGLRENSRRAGRRARRANAVAAVQPMHRPSTTQRRDEGTVSVATTAW